MSDRLDYSIPWDTELAFRHKPDGVNVLYADGHVSFKSYIAGSWEFDFPVSDRKTHLRWSNDPKTAKLAGVPIARPNWKAGSGVK
ncbi:H-X9-DG-CTERM domain-containing protein [Candidatus Hydrogenedentota bacterium]